MTTDVDKVALTIFVAFFVLVTVMGFVAARWRRPKNLARLDEWGLGGRQFGTWITWFLVGGDFYTAYTVIAVPALVYAVGAYGFFALPYTIIVYPFVFAVMPVPCGLVPGVNTRPEQTMGIMWPGSSRRVSQPKPINRRPATDGSTRSSTTGSV